MQVIKFETGRQPHALGGSVFGYNDAYKRLHSFLRQWRAAGQAGPSRPSPPLYHATPTPPGSPLTQQTQPHMEFGPPEVATAADFSSPRHCHRSTGDAAAGVRNNGGDVDRDSATRPVPYIVSVDVSRAFDNIDADMLLGIVEPLLRSPEYLIIKYSEVGAETRLPVSACIAACIMLTEHHHILCTRFSVG